MARIPSLSGTVSTARKVAQRAVVTARPVVFDVAGRLAAHLPGRADRTPPSAPETFTPSKESATVDPSADLPGGAPSPATIARNVAAPRPTAKEPAARKPRSAPGAKLPVRRPNPST